MVIMQIFLTRTISIMMEGRKWPKETVRIKKQICLLTRRVYEKKKRIKKEKVVACSNPTGQARP